MKIFNNYTVCQTENECFIENGEEFATFDLAFKAAKKYIGPFIIYRNGSRMGDWNKLRGWREGVAEPLPHSVTDQYIY